jgi:3-deoxy-D-manno-octulosonate 8-phosphate phosphatase (KDO 8-P phosphatase)
MTIALEAQLKKIKMLALDVDGVLTDGSINIGERGESFKAFNAKDGLAISAAIRHGLKVVVVTGRVSSIVHTRARELNLTQVCEGVRDKGKILRQLAAQYKLELDEIAFMGDDLNDLAALTRVGLAAAPADAAAEVLAVSAFVAKHDGGRGAVRELVEAILKAQGLWEQLLAEYQRAGQGDKQ